MATRKRNIGLMEVHPHRGNEFPQVVQDRIADRQERQQFRTTNYNAFKEFEDDIAAFRKAVRTMRGDHSALLDKMIASSRRVVDLAKQGA